MSQKITPFLWFDNKAEEAAKFYVSIFSKNPARSKGISKIREVADYSDSGAEVSGQPKGTLMTVSFTLNGQEFVGLNGGPLFKFTEAISFIVDCKTQKEVDYFWEKLSAGGSKSQCGWLKDKYGVSWQIVPEVLAKLISGRDGARSERVMNAMLKMARLDIEGLTRAYKGK